MTLRLELTVKVVEPADDADRAIAEAIREIQSDPGYRVSPEWHDLVANCAVMLAKVEWREADRFRELRRQRDERAAKTPKPGPPKARKQP